MTTHKKDIQNKTNSDQDKNLSSGSKIGKNLEPERKSPQGSHANPRTTSRGADSTDKEFRNNQLNDITSQNLKSGEQKKQNKNK